MKAFILIFGLFLSSLTYLVAQTLSGKDYLALADIQKDAKNWVLARNYALKAIESDNTLIPKVYNYIGDLYIASYEDCHKEKPIIAKIAFVAAYNHYMKANNLEKAQQVRKLFPTREEIFTHSLDSSYQPEDLLNCWQDKTIKKKD